MKKLILLNLLLSLFLRGYSMSMAPSPIVQPTYSLSVTLTDNTQWQFIVTDDLTLVFENQTLTIRDKDNSQVVSVFDVADLRYVNTEGIETIHTDYIEFDGIMVKVNTQGVTHVDFYSTAGHLLRRTPLDGARSVSTEGLYGVIIVSVGPKSFKLCVGL